MSPFQVLRASSSKAENREMRQEAKLEESSAEIAGRLDYSRAMVDTSISFQGVACWSLG